MAQTKVKTKGITDTNVTNAKLGTDISAAKLTAGTVADARFPATLPAASGVNLTALNATNIGSGTVPTARLGTGTASSTTVLYGDQTYKAEPSGKVKQIVSTDATGMTTDATNFSSYNGGTIADIGTAHITVSFTPTNASSIIVVSASSAAGLESNSMGGAAIFSDSTCKAYMTNNGYSVDGSGFAIHAAWVAGSTSAVDIEFRSIGSYIGSNTRLGTMHGGGTPAATNPLGTMTIMEVLN
jgi:hypothetical protein